MQITAVNPATVPTPPPGRYSHAVRVDLGTGALLFVSGQVAMDADGRLVGEGDMVRQTEVVFDNLGRILADQGATFAHVINIRTFLTDLSLLSEYARARRGYLTGDLPTSTTVEAPRLFLPGALVEVDVVAAIPA